MQTVDKPFCKEIHRVTNDSPRLAKVYQLDEKRCLAVYNKVCDACYAITSGNYAFISRKTAARMLVARRKGVVSGVESFVGFFWR